MKHHNKKRNLQGTLSAEKPDIYFNLCSVHLMNFGILCLKVRQDDSPFCALCSVVQLTQNPETMTSQRDQRPVTAKLSVGGEH